MRSWLTRSLLSWVVECGVDGFRVDSVGTLKRVAVPGDGEDWRHCADFSSMLPEAWAWMAEFGCALRAVLPEALLIAEDLTGDTRLFTAAGFDSDWEDAHALHEAVASPSSDLGAVVQLALDPPPPASSFTSQDTRPNPHWARCLYLGSHDTVTENRRGSLWQAAFGRAAVAGAEAEAASAQAAVSGGSGGERARHLAAKAQAALAAVRTAEGLRAAATTACAAALHRHKHQDMLSSHSQVGLQLGVAAQALLALGIPGMLMIMQGEEVCSPSRPSWPAPPVLCYPCPPPGSQAFGALVAQGAALRLRAALPAVAGEGAGWVSVHCNGGGRVVACCRCSWGGRRGGAAAQQPAVQLGSLSTPGTAALVLCNLGGQHFHKGYRVGLPRGGVWAPVLDTGELLRSALPRQLERLQGAGALDTGGMRSEAVDGARSCLAQACAAALAGVPWGEGEGQGRGEVHAAAWEAVQAEVALAQSVRTGGGGGAGAGGGGGGRGEGMAPAWVWGEPLLAEESPYDNLPANLYIPSLPPYTVRVYCSV